MSFYRSRERAGRFPRTPLIVVVLLAVSGPSVPAQGQFAGDRTSNLGAGVRVGPSKGATELEDQDEFLVHGFMQRTIKRKWQGELGLGYGQLTNTRYTTDMLMAHARLMRTLMAFEEWYGFWYSGLGLIDYDIKAADGVADPSYQSLGLTRSLMTGAGFQVSLSSKLTLEVGGGYTYALTDRLNGSRVENGNDAFWSWSLGLRIEERPRGSGGGRPAPVASGPSPPPVDPEVPETFVPSAAELPAMAGDQDGDGLSDIDERKVYFTNPMMRDSDADGLSDGEEALTYGTNPNEVDSDGGGVGDGVEVGRDTDPWESTDDEALERGLIQLPTIFFDTDGGRLDAGDEVILDQLAALLRERPDVLLQVRGFTDDLGGEAENFQLAGARANAVYEYLLSQGVEEHRLSTRAIGEEDPRAPNDTLEGRRENRRVELIERK